jgi:nucleoside-diphosphate-sugar epimerase
MGAVEEPSEQSHVTAHFVCQALINKEIQVLTDEKKQRKFIHLDDVCSAFRHCLGSRLLGVHDVTSLEWVRVLNAHHMIAASAGAKVVLGERAGSTPIPLRGRLPNWLPRVPLDVRETN